MKFGKVTGKKATGAAVMVGGATVGAMLSDAVVNAIPLSNPTHKRLAVLALSGVALAAFSGDKTADKAVQGAIAGMAIQQAVKTSREGLTKVLPASATSNSFVQSALGSDQALNGKYLGAPIKNWQPNTFKLGNPQMPATNPEQKTLSINPATLVG